MGPLGSPILGPLGNPPRGGGILFVVVFCLFTSPSAALSTSGSFAFGGGAGRSWNSGCVANSSLGGGGGLDILGAVGKAPIFPLWPIGKPPLIEGRVERSLLAGEGDLPSEGGGDDISARDRDFWEEILALFSARGGKGDLPLTDGRGCMFCVGALKSA